MQPIRPDDPVFPVKRWKGTTRNNLNQVIDVEEDKPGLPVRLELAGRIAASIMTPRYLKDVSLPGPDKVALAAFNVAEALIDLENQKRAGKPAPERTAQQEIEIKIEREFNP